MIDVEIQRKREKGICFRCDGKYSVGHRCGEKQFQIILIDDEEDDPDPIRSGDTVETGSEQ